MALRETNLIQNGNFDNPSGASWEKNEILQQAITFENDTVIFTKTTSPDGQSLGEIFQTIDLSEGHTYEVSFSLLNFVVFTSEFIVTISVGGNEKIISIPPFGVSTFEITAGSSGVFNFNVDIQSVNKIEAIFDDFILFDLTPEHYFITQENVDPSANPIADVKTIIVESDGKTSLDLGAAPTSGTFSYTVTAEAGAECSRRSTTSDAIVFGFDSFGNIIETPSFDIFDLFAQPTEGGKIEIFWRYTNDPFLFMPTHFNIYWIPTEELRIREIFETFIKNPSEFNPSCEVIFDPSSEDPSAILVDCPDAIFGERKIGEEILNPSAIDIFTLDSSLDFFPSFNKYRLVTETAFATGRAITVIVVPSRFPQLGGDPSAEEEFDTQLEFDIICDASPPVTDDDPDMIFELF